MTPRGSPLPLSARVALAVRHRRRVAGLDRKQLAARTGVSVQSIGQIERGAVKYSALFRLEALARALNTDLVSLIKEARQDY